MDSIWARMVRVAIIQDERRRRSTAISSTVIARTLVATSTSTAMPGMVIITSAAMRITVSTMPPKKPANRPSTIADAEADQAGEQADLQRLRRGEHQRRRARPGPARRCRARWRRRAAGAAARAPTWRERGVDDERPERRETAGSAPSRASPAMQHRLAQRRGAGGVARAGRRESRSSSPLIARVMRGSISGIDQVDEEHRHRDRDREQQHDALDDEIVLGLDRLVEPVADARDRRRSPRRGWRRRRRGRASARACVTCGSSALRMP